MLAYEQEVKSLRRANASLRNLLAGQNRREDLDILGESRPSSRPTFGHIADHQGFESPPHYATPWSPTCETCGDPNEDYRSETECENCGHSLGRIATVKDIDDCPGCGAHGGVKVKLDRYVKCDSCSRPLAATSREAKKLSECPGCGGSTLAWSTGDEF